MTATKRGLTIRDSMVAVAGLAVLLGVHRAPQPLGVPMLCLGVYALYLPARKVSGYSLP